MKKNGSCGGRKEEMWDGGKGEVGGWRQRGKEKGEGSMETGKVRDKKRWSRRERWRKLQKSGRDAESWERGMGVCGKVGELAQR